MRLLLNKEKNEINYYVPVTCVPLGDVPEIPVENPDGCVLLEDPVGTPVEPK